MENGLCVVLLCHASCMLEIVAALRLAFTALLFPASCVYCGEPDTRLCHGCEFALQGEQPQPPRDLGFPVFFCWQYAGQARSVLRAYKYAGQIGFCGVLARGLRSSLTRAAQYVAVRGLADALCVCVPSSRQRVRERGFQHLRLLLKAALADARLGNRYWLASTVLRVRYSRKPQRGLAESERWENAKLLYVPKHLREIMRGRNVILVDDVVTTGASLLGAAAALRECGARVIAAAVLCNVSRGRNGSGNPQAVLSGGWPAGVELR